MLDALRETAKDIRNPLALPSKLRCPFGVIVHKKVDVMFEPKHGGR